MASVGILIIGSLYWQNDPVRDPIRANWQSKRLDLTKQYKVKAPIRYGRLAHKRSNTYTMVFSRDCQKPGTVGEAIAVRCQNDVATLPELRKEADELWTAECAPRAPSKSLHGDWGCVVLLENPRHSPRTLVADWKGYILGLKYPILRTASGEPPVATADGMLTIDWPQLADGSGPLDLDLLLATATEPSLMGGRYANPAEIASAWRSAPHEVYYFHNNRTNGITTFEDADILKLLV